MSESKVFWKSKTLWVNVLVVVAAFFTELSNFLGTDGTLTLVAIANILLRVITKSGVTLK